MECVVCISVCVLSVWSTFDLCVYIECVMCMIMVVVSMVLFDLCFVGLFLVFLLCVGCVCGEYVQSVVCMLYVWCF